MKKKLYLLLTVMIIGIMLLNGILFYSAKLSAEYLQSKNVWGETQVIRISDYQRQSNLLDSLPKDPAEAELITEKILTYVERRYDLRSMHLANWRIEELSITPEELRDSMLLNEIQDEDHNNYVRLHSLTYGISHYREYVESVQKNADGVISVLYPIEQNEADYNNALQCKRDYSDLSHLVLVPALDNGINLFLQYHATDFFAFLLLAMMSLLFYYYLKRRALLMAESIRSLVGTMLFFFVLGLSGLYLTNLVITAHVLGLPSLQIPLQSLEAFYFCPYPISIGTFLVLWLFIKTCTMLFFTVCMHACDFRKAAGLYHPCGHPFSCAGIICRQAAGWRCFLRSAARDQPVFRPYSGTLF